MSSDLMRINGIGEVVGKSVYDWFQDKENSKLIDRLLKHIKISHLDAGRPSGKKLKLSSKTFVLTGTMKSMTRDEAKEKIRVAGGNVQSSVSNKTDYVIAGEKAGSKLAMAKKLGVKILSEKEFKKLM